MFEKLFEKASAVINHKTAPYAAERVLYLKRCAEEGYAREYIKRIAYVLLAVVHELRHSDDGSINEEQLQALADRSARMHRQYTNAWFAFRRGNLPDDGRRSPLGQHGDRTKREVL